MLPAAGPGTCWGGVRARISAYVHAFASTSLYSVFRPGQASGASASVSGRVFVFQLPGASSLVVCALVWYLLRPLLWRAGLRLLHWWHAVWFDVCVWYLR